MITIRRALQVFALVGTLMVGVVALALIVSQTPWFRDWLRRYIVRESKQYVNGEVSIGGLDGNLLFGVGLSDVAVDVSGQRLVAIKGLQVDYSVFQLLSGGIVIDDIKVIGPSLRVVRDAGGWNLAHLVKEQAQEADRKGPGRAVTLRSIELTDGSVAIDDKVGSGAYRLPSQIDGLHVKGSFQYEPVHYSITLDDVRFRGTAPDLTLQQLAGGLAVRDDNLYLQKIAVRTAASTITIDGVIQQYLQTPTLALSTSGSVSLPEISKVLPAAEGYVLTPTFDLKARGAADRLALDLDVKSEAGNVRGQLTADLQSPDVGGKGELNLDSLNLAPILKDPAQRSDFTGHAKIDLTLASAPEAAPALDRLRGTFGFKGPRVVAAGYQAADVQVTGAIAGPRITVDGRAAAYGGTATAAGFIVVPAEKRPLAFDLHGRAAGVDLRRLPATTGAPKLATNLSVSAYQVRASGGRIDGSATLEASEVEGASIAAGTVAEFASEKGNVSYSSRGSVSHLNLQRIGKVFAIAALDKPDYDSELNSTFDVKGAGTKVETMTLDATGTLTDSDAWGAHLPQLSYEAHLSDGALTARANGRFEHLDPGRVSGNAAVNGTVTGTANVNARIANINAPITGEAITADGTVTLESSKVGDLAIDQAELEARYASQIADVTRLTLAGPAVQLEASGQVATDKTSPSSLKYHVEALDLAALAKLAGQEGVAGTAVVDGTVAGNATSLETTGTLTGNQLGYQSNNALELKSQYTVIVPDLQFANAQVKATSGATFVKVGGLEINELTATTSYADKRLAFDTKLKQPERDVDASGDVVFHTDHQEIHLPSFALRTQGVEWRTVPGSAAAVQYGNDRIELTDVKLVSGDQTLDVNGAFALKAGQAPAALTVQAHNVDISQLEHLALQNRGFSGRVDATAKIEGTTDAPVVSGHVQVTNGGFQTYKYQSLVADLGYHGTQVDLDTTLQQSPTEAVTVKGTMPTTLFKRSDAGHVEATPGDQVDLHITSTALNLGVIQGFTTAVTNVTGVVRADVRLTGSGQDPHVEGIINIEGGGFGVPATGVTYKGLDTSIALTSERITIPNLHIVDEEGEQLTITGSLGMHAREVGAVDVTITSKNFELIDNELGDVGIETNLKITGEMRRPKIVGDAKLQSARLEVDKILAFFYDPYSVSALPDVVSAERTTDGSASAEEATRQALSTAQTSAAPASAASAGAAPTAAAPAAKEDAAADDAPAPAGAFGPVEMQVHLKIPENLVLRGKSIRPGGPTGAALGDLNITVGGDLDITKAPDAPVILLGSVDTVRGTYQFQGRRFDLVRGGTIRFIGETEINPNLDVTATRVIPNVGIEARVHITGTAKAPQLELTSNPPLDQSDILALIVFNRPVNELGSGERSSLAATAGGIATGFLAAPLGDSIGRALDLDLFEITTSTDDGDLGAGVTVGQQIGDRMFFKLRQQFGERTTSEFMLEYQLSDFLRMQANAAPETSGSANRIGQRRIERAGIDLIFFFSY